MAGPPNTTLARILGSARRAPGTNPVLAKYLDDLAGQARRQAALDDAARLDVHFGRVTPADPMAGIGGDDIAGMVGATAAPRQWLEAADYNRTIGDMLPQRGYEVPFADELARNDRTRALTGARLDRMTPEQQASSLPFVGRMAEMDANAAAAAAREAARRYNADLQTAAALAAGGVIGGGALYGVGSRLANDMIQGDEVDPESDPQQAVRQLMDDPGVAVPQEETDYSYMVPRADVSELISDPPFLGADQPAEARTLPGDFWAEPLIDGDGIGPQDEEYDISYLGATSDFGRDPLRRIRETNLTLDDPVLELTHNPSQPEAYSPPVAVEREPLPGPKARSIQALMRAGIAEPRARDIILKGYSMSPDEYRAVTGGRR